MSPKGQNMEKLTIKMTHFWKKEMEKKEGERRKNLLLHFYFVEV